MFGLQSHIVDDFYKLSSSKKILFREWAHLPVIYLTTNPFDNSTSKYIKIIVRAGKESETTRLAEVDCLPQFCEISFRNFVAVVHASCSGHIFTILHSTESSDWNLIGSKSAANVRHGSDVYPVNTLMVLPPKEANGAVYKARSPYLG